MRGRDSYLAFLCPVTDPSVVAHLHDAVRSIERDPGRRTLSRKTTGTSRSKASALRRSGRHSQTTSLTPISPASPAAAREIFAAQPAFDVEYRPSERISRSRLRRGPEQRPCARPQSPRPRRDAWPRPLPFRRRDISSRTSASPASRRTKGFRSSRRRSAVCGRSARPHVPHRGSPARPRPPLRSARRRWSRSRRCAGLGADAS